MEPLSIEPVILTAKLLQKAIASVARRHPTNCKLKEGYGCEFALALATALCRRHIEHKIRLGLRTETSLAEEQAIPVTQFSYAVLQALDTSWDTGGPEAQPRWEARWPYSTQARCRFSWKNTRQSEANVASINKLVLTYGGMAIDEGLLSHLSKELEKILPASCVAAQEIPDKVTIRFKDLERPGDEDGTKGE